MDEDVESITSNDVYLSDLFSLPFYIHAILTRFHSPREQ